MGGDSRRQREHTGGNHDDAGLDGPPCSGSQRERAPDRRIADTQVRTTLKVGGERERSVAVPDDRDADPGQLAIDDLAAEELVLLYLARRHLRLAQTGSGGSIEYASRSR